MTRGELSHAFRFFLALTLALVALAPSETFARTSVSLGSKAFTEGVLLGELSSRLCADGAPGAKVTHRKQLGGSVVLYLSLIHI